MKTFAEVQREFPAIPAERWKRMEMEQGEAWIARTERTPHHKTEGHPEQHGGSWVLYMADGARAPLHDHLVVEGYEYSEHIAVLDGDALYGWDSSDFGKRLRAGSDVALVGVARHQPYVLSGEYVVVRFHQPGGSKVVDPSALTPRDRLHMHPDARVVLQHAGEEDPRARLD